MLLFRWLLNLLMSLLLGHSSRIAGLAKVPFSSHRCRIDKFLGKCGLLPTLMENVSALEFLLLLLLLLKKLILFLDRHELLICITLEMFLLGSTTAVGTC